VPIPTIATISSHVPAEPLLLTNTKEDELGYFSTDFSPEAGFYLLTYQGPNTPWQRIVMVNNTGELLYCRYTHVFMNADILPAGLPFCPLVTVNYSAVTVLRLRRPNRL